MSDASGMRVVGTIRSIELYASMAKFQSVAPRQVARIVLEIEQATQDAEAQSRLSQLRSELGLDAAPAPVEAPRPAEG